MEIIDSILTLIKNLKSSHTKKDSWLVRPYIVGHTVDYVIDDNGIMINGSLYPCNFINFTNPHGVKGQGRAVIGLNSQFIKSKRANSVLVIEHLTRIEFSKDPNATINESYIFSLDNDSVLPSIPYTQTHQTIYTLLNSLSVLDRNIRVTDWSVHGIVIKNTQCAMRYIKEPFESISCVTDITHCIDNNGGVYSIAYFTPISFNGLIVIKSVLKNKRLKINVGDIVTVRINRQGNHKGDIQSVVYPCPLKKEKVVLTHCQYCNSLLFKKPSTSDLYCLNELCSGVLIKKIVYWCNKDSMDIKGIGEKMATHLINNKIITTVDELYTLSVNDLTKINGMLDKSAKNIILRIYSSKQTSLKKVISSLGIEDFNSRYAKILAWSIKELSNLLFVDKNTLSILPSKQSKAVMAYMKKESNKVLIANLSRLLNAAAPSVKPCSHPFVGQSFKIIGLYPPYSRDDIVSLLNQANIKVVDSTSANDCYWLHYQLKKTMPKQNGKKNITFFKLLNYILD